MQNRYSLLLVLLFTATFCNAQFTGIYKLAEGNAMQDSMLVVLPNNEFAITNYGIMKTGKWQQTDTNKIVLHEQQMNDQYFTVYGSTQANKNANSTFLFSNINDTNIGYGFSKDSIANPNFFLICIPEFNGSRAGCEANVVSLHNQYQFIKLVCPANPFIKGANTNDFYKAMVYTFPLSEKYANYHIVYDGNAMKPIKPLELEKKGETYFLNGVEVDARKALTDSLVKKIEACKMQLTTAFATGKTAHYSNPSPGSEKIVCANIDVVEMNSVMEILPSISQIKKQYEGDWINEKTKENLRITFWGDQDYADVNIWKGKLENNNEIDVFKVFVKDSKLVLAQNHGEPYCEMLIKNKKLLFQCKDFINDKGISDITIYSRKK